VCAPVDLHHVERFSAPGPDVLHGRVRIHKKQVAAMAMMAHVLVEETGASVLTLIGVGRLAQLVVAA